MLGTLVDSLHKMACCAHHSLVCSV